MSISINTNGASMVAARALTAQAGSLATSQQRLSTGFRVNSAKDDAAGLAIATRMDSQARGMGVAIRNANDGISLAQTADSALASVTDSLQRMRELAVQSRNGSNSDTAKDQLDKEFQALGDEVNRILTNTNFNGKAILSTDAGAMEFQVGAGTTADNRISLTTTDMTADTDITAISAGAIDSAATDANIEALITNLDNAMETISGTRSDFGAASSRFEMSVSNLRSAQEATLAAKGRIMDTDFAAETANMAKRQVLQQAAMSMVAQANQQPSQVLALLR